ncbi:DNA internalization-related competence protein ComEC/Rec2 [Trichloromonas acetexigens]|uniref:DNA internalization-related competence protein ComEC/Rec2 n=1 Tax=Trichloromonas acetexigens TaxID=38815 RepID=A0A550J8K2_9BACT|nr:DNA internalization-related competence protein ComEC/Rec2 [Desulfuromonas acetexigens]TRO79521.1 DNA internalization-related competence protein ComEC/Rec2 [Desulfuromonas acetexigens]
MAIWHFLSAYAAGLASAPYLPAPWDSPLVPGLCAFVAGISVLFIRRLGIVLPILFFYLLGIAFYQNALSPPTAPDHIRAFTGTQTWVIEGRVRALAQRQGGGFNLEIATERIVDGEESRAVSGILLVSIDQGESPVRSGSRVRFIARPRAPRPFGLPGEFDYPRHLAYRDIFATAHLTDTRELVVFADPPGVGLTPSRLREGLGKAIDRAVSDEAAPLVRALVIGDKSLLRQEDRERLARGGVSHLFAISGLHLGLVAALLYAGANLLYRRSERLLLLAPARRLLPLLLLAPLFGYLLLTGDGIATRRAFVMLTAVALLMSANRQTPPVKLLASCALIFLLAEPLILFQPAFQLSFAGLFGILVLVPRWHPGTRRWPKGLSYAVGLALTTVAATVTTTPLVLANFHLLAPAGLVTNLFAVPLIGLVAVPLGLGGALLLPLWEAGANLLLTGCGQVTLGVLELVDRTVDLPLLRALTCYASPGLLAASALLALSLLLPGGSRRRWLGRAGCALFAGLLLIAPERSSSALTVTSLSVGQGDATLLTLDGGRHFLIDGGGFHDTRFDVGRRLLAPALGRLGVRRLEAVILTHDHPDHSQGLTGVLETFPVDEFWTAQPAEKLNDALRASLAKSGVPVVIQPPGWSLRRERDERSLWIFTPEQNTDNLNDASLVLLVRDGDNGALLTGDLEEAGIEQLLAHPLPYQVNLLKLPHHGSGKCHPEWLLDEVRPKLAFASLGFGNRFRFPHVRVTDALEARGIPLWRTDRDGSLRFVSDSRTWQATHWNQRLFR